MDFAVFHYPSPFFQYSIIPVLQYSITPFSLQDRFNETALIQFPHQTAV